MNIKRLFLMIFGNTFNLPRFIYNLIKSTNDKSLSIEDKYSYIREIIISANKKGRVNVIVEGKENIPKENGYLICPNHQGYYDSLALAEAIDIPFSAVINKKYANKIFLRDVIKALNIIEIDRNDIKSSFEVIKEVVKRLKEGKNILIFPEGTRSKKGNELNDMLAGAFKSVTLSKAKILPVALIDCFIPFDRKGIEEVNVRVSFLESITYDEYKNLKTVEIAKLVKDKIQEYIDEKIK